MLLNKHTFSVSPLRRIIKEMMGPNSVEKKLAVALILAAGAMNAAPVLANAENARGIFPVMRFADKAHGEEAVRRLGRNLPGVAAWYRMTPEKLSRILRHDDHAWLDEEGRLLYIDDFPEPSEITSTSETTTLTDAAPYPLQDTFLLHSKPGSKRTIYLDFDGHTTNGNGWSSGSINADPFDLDGVPNDFNTAEREAIQNIWRRVAEDFAPFDVDVTTEDPGSDALARTSSLDQNYGSRVVITRNNFGACTSCGGIAYVGVFDYYSLSRSSEYYQPAWVFFDALGGREKYIAEASSHEAGHNLGLSHDGSPTSNYYIGHGSGATGWAPIMGVGYSRELVQWSKGEYDGANNQEDDLSVMQNNGAALNSDDAGNNMSSAAALAGSDNAGTTIVNQSGLISQASDVDYFSFVSGSGQMQISLAPAALVANLDASLELLDGEGRSIAYSNPADALDAGLTVNLNEGNYFLKVDGVGKGDLSSGYSDYGSLGRYVLTGSYPTASSSGVAPVSVLNALPSSGYAPLDVGFFGNQSYDPDGNIVAYYWDFGDGSSSTEANPNHTYNTPGTYHPVLTVTDQQGLKSSDTLPINVMQDPVSSILHVGGILMDLKKTGKNYQCIANVTILDADDMPVSGANVSGIWSGDVSSGVVSNTSDSSGVARFASSKMRRSTGSCMFTVKDVVLTGWSYDASQNQQNSDGLSF